MRGQAFTKYTQQAIKRVLADMSLVLMQDAKEIIISKSGEQLPLKTEKTLSSFKIGVPYVIDDPTGDKVKEIERKTEAFETAYLKLKNKAYVISVLKKEL